MRILFITNYYPPFEVGGYEQLCRDVAERLTARGHTINILTSNWGVDKCQDAAESGVHRLLHIHPQNNARLGYAAQFFLTRRRTEAYNRRILHTVVEEVCPDVIFIWNLQGLPYELALDAEGFSATAVAYWLAGYTPAEPDLFWRYWMQPPGKKAYLKHIKDILRHVALAQMKLEGKPVRPQMHHVGVVSEYMRQKGILEGTLPTDAHIIYNGVELDQFTAANSPNGDKLRLLVAGRISEDKGIHTALEALHKVVETHVNPKIHLTVVGKGPEEYRHTLVAYIKDHGLSTYVDLKGWVDRSVMPQIMANADVLLLPSIYPEALPRVVLEAMAARLTVITTSVGGTGEIVEHDVTGLIFNADDSSCLADQIERVLIEPGLRTRLAKKGQQRVLERFSMDGMVHDVEKFLITAVAEQSYAS